MMGNIELRIPFRAHRLDDFGRPVLRLFDLLEEHAVYFRRLIGVRF